MFPKYKEVFRIAEGREVYDDNQYNLRHKHHYYGYVSQEDFSIFKHKKSNISELSLLLCVPCLCGTAQGHWRN